MHPTPHPETVLVTGASSGIGLELARLFAAEKYRMILTARNVQALERLGEECRALGASEVAIIPADLSDPNGPTKLTAEIAAKGWQVDLLINNAGFGTHGAHWEIELDKEIALLQVNVVSLVHLTRLLLPAMVSRGRGRILNVASTAAYQPGPLMANYYASKAYVLSFSEALSVELKRTGVTVTALCPGPTTTDFQNRAGIAASELFKHTGLSAAEVARMGYKGLLAGKRVVITGLKNRLLVASSRLAPKSAVMRVVKKLNESR